MDKPELLNGVFRAWGLQLSLCCALLFFSACENPVTKELKTDSGSTPKTNSSTPSITLIDDVTIAQDSSATVTFKIADSDSTLNCQNAIYVSTTDASLLPPTAVVRSGTAPNCSLKLTPSAGYWGSATIGVTVYDGKYSASTSFTLTVTEGTPVATAANASANEGSNITFTVQLSQAAPLTKTVSYSTANVTAISGTNYTSTSGTLTFAPGETSKTLTVPTIHDSVHNPNLTFTLTLTVAGVTRNATGTVVNTDAAPTASASDASANEGSNITFTVNLNRTSYLSQTVTYSTTDGTAADGTNYTGSSGTLTYAPGESSKTITVPTLADGTYTPALTFTLNLTANSTTNTATGTVTNTDAAPTASASAASANEGSAITFTVNLTRPSSSTTSVTYSTTNGTALSGTNYTAASGTLTFAAGETSKTVSVTTLTDSTYSNDLTFTLSLTANSTTNTATGTVVNTDSVPVVSVAANSSRVTEGTSAGFTISLNHASAFNVQVDYATANGTAASGSDYTSTSGTATITAGALSTSVSVTNSDDNLDETDETFSLQISNPSNASIGTNSASVTLEDTALSFSFLGGTLPSGLTFARASSASYYDSSGTLQTASSGTARFDHNPGSCAGTCALRGLLIEEARTNLLLRSAAFDSTWSSAGTAGVTISANATTAPDGNSTADTVTSNSTTSANSDRTEQTVTLLASTTYTLSFFVKNSSSSQSRFELNAFNSGTTGKLSTVTWTGGVPSLSVGTIEALPNSWYRLSITFTTNASDAGTATVAFYPAVSAADTFGAVELWGAQLEVGSIVSSYIATTNSMATRAADALTIDNFSSWFNANAWTAILDFVKPAYELSSASRTSTLFSACDDTSGGTCTSDNFQAVYLSGDSTLRGRSTVSSAIVATSNYTNVTDLSGTTVQAGVSQSSTGELRTVVNGSAATLSGAASKPTLHNFVLGAAGRTGAYSSQLQGHVRKFTFRTRALTSGQLQAMTTD